MPIDFFEKISELQPEDVSILGLDVGKKTIGLALYEPVTDIITPLKTLKRVKFTQDIHSLKTTINEYDIGGYVVGLPLNADGSENPSCQRIRDFVSELMKYPDVVGHDPWIAYIDEHLSTESVDSIVDEIWDISKGKAKSRGMTDSLAAVEILRRAFE